MGDLTGKTSFVTGAAEGIGFGIALELARSGSRVVIADRNIEKARAAAQDMKKAGHDAISVALDVTDTETVSKGVNEAIERLLRIDILVNNAGIHCERLGQLSTEEHFNQCFDVNLLGVWRVTQALVPHFKAFNTGKVVNIASIDGRRPWADTPAYSASKAALISLTQSLAIKLGGDDINVNAICPGGVMTAMADAFIGDRPALQEEIVRARLLRRPLLPEDIGHAVVFLVSARARNITGQALNVDGGAVLS